METFLQNRSGKAKNRCHSRIRGIPYSRGRYLGGGGETDPHPLPDRNKSRVGRKRPRRLPSPTGQLVWCNRRPRDLPLDRAGSYTRRVRRVQLLPRADSNPAAVPKRSPIPSLDRTLSVTRLPHSAAPLGCAERLESSPPHSGSLTHRESTAERYECPDHRTQERFTALRRKLLDRSPQPGVPFLSWEFFWPGSRSILSVTTSCNTA